MQWFRCCAQDAYNVLQSVSASTGKLATATTVRTLLRMATGIDKKRMSSAPASGIAGWTDDETSDLTAITADHAEGFMYMPHGVSSTQQFPKALLALPEDRFALKFREEEKEVSVYLPE